MQIRRAMIHPNEPKLSELKVIRGELFTAESNEENVKKLKAIDSQISRHEAVIKARKEKEEASK